MSSDDWIESVKESLAIWREAMGWNTSSNESIFEMLNVLKGHSELTEVACYHDRAITTPEAKFERWQDLPYEIALKIIGYMSTITRIKLGATSTYYRNIVKNLPITLGIKYMKMDWGGHWDHYEGAELISRYFDDNLLIATRGLKTLSVEFDDGDWVTLGIIMDPLIAFDNPTVVVWSTNSGKVKTCNIDYDDPDHWLFDTFLKYAKMSRTKVQNLYIDLNWKRFGSSEHAFMFARNLMRCSSMSELKSVILLTNTYGFNKSILESCQPDSLKLEVVRRPDIAAIFTKCGNMHNINRVYFSEFMPRVEQFLQFRSNDIRIEHSGCSMTDAKMINRFLHLWATGKLRPSFHYCFFDHGTRRSALSDDKLIDELLVEKIREPPVSLLESLKDCADDTFYERWMDNYNDPPKHWGKITKIQKFSNPDQIGYLVAKERSIIFVVPQIAKNDNGKIEYKKVDMEFDRGHRSSLVMPLV